MRNFRHLFRASLYLCPFILLLSACEQPVFVPLDEYESRIVVQGELAKDSLPIVYLTESQPFYGYVEQLLMYQFVKGATVVLIGPDGADTLESRTRYENLFATRDSILIYYYLGKKPIRQGAEYQLSAVQGERKATARMKVPQPVTIKSAYQDTVFIDQNGVPYISDVFLRVTFDDPAGIASGFRLTYTYLMPNYEWDYDPGQNQWTATDTTFNFVESMYTLYDDTGVDGTEVSAKLPFNRTFKPVGGPDTLSVTLTLAHLGPELSSYYASLDKQSGTSGDPLTEPVLLFSNIEGGLGVFGGMALSPPFKATYIAR